ncbi:hypothetical protein MNB_SV-4-836 [hydrothermal vent metagenome]|uniref:Uncharacterized protein n=1 Tax=hydrothermal vent metagenome TaxID=652676 RepID=A0A1W1E9I2_9ZZZZ
MAGCFFLYHSPIKTYLTIFTYEQTSLTSTPNRYNKYKLEKS